MLFKFSVSTSQPQNVLNLLLFANIEDAVIK